VYTGFGWVGKPEGMRTLGRHEHRWEDNIKINLLEVRWDSMDWIDLAQGQQTCLFLSLFHPTVSRGP
jgi:hypothetical protein